jgi:hypothetical protein
MADPERCPTCCGSGQVLIVDIYDARGRPTGTRRPVAASCDDPDKAVAKGILPCPDCEGSRRSYPDFDEKSITIRMADPAESVEVYLNRSSPVGGTPPIGESLSASLAIVTTTLRADLVGLGPAGLRRLARFLDLYAQRMEEF